MNDAVDNLKSIISDLESSIRDVYFEIRQLKIIISSISNKIKDSEKKNQSLQQMLPKE